VLSPRLGAEVTLVNARSLAADHKIDVVEATTSGAVGYPSLMVLRLKTASGDLSVTGTLFGRNHVRLVDIDGVDVDVIPQGHLLLVRNDDTPGVVGHIGTLLGESRVNIARMAVGRKPGSGRAVMLIEIDSEAPAVVVAKVAAIAGVREARSIRLG
jgi:D-3-phosphoglycerate dehydrogenase